MTSRSKHRLKGQIVKIRRGVAIYQTHAGPYYYARILHSKTGKYVVRSTKETSRLEARKVAEELAYDMRKNERVAEPEYSFKYYAQRYVEKARGQAQRGERNANYVRTATVALDNDDWGLVRHFATRDVRELKTRDWQLFIEKITAKRPDLSSSTRNTLMASYPLRNKVIALLSIKAGLRAKEIANLTWDMITDAQGRLTNAIHLRNAASKGKSGRVIPLNKELRAALLELQKQAGQSPYVITTERSEQFSSAAIVNLFAAWYRAIGLQGCSSHTNAARKISTVGGSLRDVQVLAGHKALSTTQRYIEADAAAQKRVVDLI